MVKILIIYLGLVLYTNSDRVIQLISLKDKLSQAAVFENPKLREL